MAKALRTVRWKGTAAVEQAGLLDNDSVAVSEEPAVPPPSPSPSPPPSASRPPSWCARVRRFMRYQWRTSPQQKRDAAKKAVEAALHTVETRVGAAQQRRAAHRANVASSVAVGNMEAAKEALRRSKTVERVLARLQTQHFALETQLQVLEESQTNHDLLRSMKRVNEVMRKLAPSGARIFERQADTMAAWMERTRECSAEMTSLSDETSFGDSMVTDDDVWEAMGTAAAPSARTCTIACQTDPQTDTAAQATQAADTLAALAAALPDVPSSDTRQDATGAAAAEAPAAVTLL